MKHAIEYRLLVTQFYKERENVTVTRLALRTVNEFTNFRYEIVVSSELAGDVLRLRIQGLRAPGLSLPSTGPATSVTEYRELHGTLTIVISKLDQEENEFVVNISGNNVVLKKSPVSGFIELVTEAADW